MPELPEVETVCRGLDRVMTGQRFTHVQQNRKNLRIPFPPRLPQKLTGQRIIGIHRRAKYILIDLDNDTTLIIHLGMSGRMVIDPDHTNKHDHLVFTLSNNNTIVFNDPRRFGLVDLCATADLPHHRLFAHLGVEPLSRHFSARYLADKIHNKKTDIKTAIMDQRVVVGVGNIYACDSLYLAGISPLRPAHKLTMPEITRLTRIIKQVLRKAIAAGGSSLRDYVQTDGSLGYFQHQWAVYGKAGQKCKGCTCADGIQRITQGGRSTFYCPDRQV